MPTPDLFEGVSKDVQDVIRAYCGWHVSPSITETITLDGPGSDTLFLPSLHVTDVASVTVDGVAQNEPEWSEAGLIRGAFHGRRFRSIVVTLTHGYAEPPHALKAAADRLTAASTAGVYAGANVRLGNISLSVPGAESSSFADTTGDPYVDRALAPYRLGIRP